MTRTPRTVTAMHRDDLQKLDAYAAAHGITVSQAVAQLIKTHPWRPAQ